MSLDGGRYQDEALQVSRETATEPEAVFRATVIEQVEIAAKYSGYIDRAKGGGGPGRLF